MNFLVVRSYEIIKLLANKSTLFDQLIMQYWQGFREMWISKIFNFSEMWKAALIPADKHFYFFYSIRE